MKKTQNKLVFVNGCRIQSCNAINLGILVLRLGWKRIVYIEHYDGFNLFSSSNKLLERGRNWSREDIQKIFSLSPQQLRTLCNMNY